jgi:hypothetical protein
MDWLPLLVVVPVVAVLVVLMFGFTGCNALLDLESVQYSPEPWRTAPTDLVAIALGPDRIRLEWKHNDPANVSFVISRIGRDLVKNPSYATVATGLGTAFDDVGVPAVEEGTLYTYTVRAKATTSTGESPESPAATARAWQHVMVYGGPDKALTTNDAPLAGACLVQRIDRTTYQPVNGTLRRIALTLRGSSAVSNLMFDQVSISHAAIPGVPDNPSPQAYDSDSNGMQRLGAQVLPGSGTPVTLAEVDFALDTGRDLIVAFDIASANANPTRGRPGVGASQAFSRANTDEAGVPNRQPGYATRTPGVYFVERIDVLVSF